MQHAAKYGVRLQGIAFAETGHFMRWMEAIAVAISQQEPVLLVGETGTGKTTLIQHLAEQVSGHFINMPWFI